MEDALIQHINSFFASNSLQCNSPWFSGLFNCRVQRQIPQEIENTHPVASTSQTVLQHTHQPLADNIVNLPNFSNSHPLEPNISGHT